MSMNLPVTYTQAHDTSKIPLGTAGWMNFVGDRKPIYAEGDLWLGRLPSGEAVGYNDDRHVLLVSGTRSGKGASIIIPNLCLWPGSAVVIDPKGENAMVTARRRAHGSAWARGQMQEVYILDPFGEVSTQHDDFADLRASYNPLDILKGDSRTAIDDAARIADALIVSEDSREPFFDDSAKTMLKALLLHVASSSDIPDDKRNLATLRNISLSGDDEMRRLLEINGEDDIPTGMSLLFKAMQRNTAYGGVVAQYGVMFEELLGSSPRTMMSVMQVLRTNTDFLDSLALRDTLSHSSFDLGNLKRWQTTVYLCLPQRYMASHYRWLRMMTALIIGEMERVRPTPAPKHPVLMVLDEFPALGRMKVIENAAAQIAGYGVKLMFVAQTLAQLKDVYKDNWETLVANAGLKLFFGNDDHFTREYVSKLIGEIEVQRWTESHSATKGTSKSRSHGQYQSESGSVSSSVTDSSGWSGGHFNFSRSTSSSSTVGWSSGTSSNSSVGSNESQTRGKNESIHKRYLLTPDEVGRLFGNRAQPAMLALASGMQPLALRRGTYFADRQFTALFDPHRDHKPPVTLEYRRQERLKAQRRTELREAEYKRLRAEKEARDAREREELLALRAAQHAAKEQELERLKREAIANARKRRITAIIRRIIQLGFVATLAWGAMQYPPIAKTVHQVATGLQIQWNIQVDRWL
ncbi:type IV secretory system conjugative DNA transfer family protein [Devosia honganensis]|uniref:Type IV secretory system conjugative DNA transfer family protein n=1 Tax=Devosia honganensis TaxID=1610527 RepID=A0ABV7X6I8_9HYPH